MRVFKAVIYLSEWELTLDFEDFDENWMRWISKGGDSQKTNFKVLLHYILVKRTGFYKSN